MRLHPNLAELYREEVAALRESLADPAIHDEAIGILRGLIEQVVPGTRPGAGRSRCAARSPRWSPSASPKRKRPSPGYGLRRLFGKGGCGGSQPP